MSVNMFLPNANEQYANIKSMCENISRNFEVLKKSILNFANETELKGKAYDSAKQYFNNTYIPLINGFILLSNAIINANNQFIENYKSQVDVNSLQSDVLENQIQRLQIIISELERISAYNSTVNFSCEHMLYCYRLKLKKIKEKLENLLSYSSSSVQIFSEIEDLLNNVKNGLLEISNGSSWDTSNHVFILNNSNSEWISNLNKKFEDKELDLILNKIPNLTENDLSKIKEYGIKYPNEEVPQSLKEYFNKNFPDIQKSFERDLISNGIKQTGTSIMKFGGLINTIGSIKGPAGNNSFIIPNNTMNSISKPIINKGSKIKSFGNGVGLAFNFYGFGKGFYDDINTNNKTVGQAFTHNATSTLVGLAASSFGEFATAGLLTLAGVSNPAGWAILGGMVAGTLLSSLFEFSYQNNFGGLQDSLDFLGGGN